MKRVRQALAVALLICSAPAAADQDSMLLPSLFDKLQTARSPSEAAEAERRIWKIWSLPDNREASAPFAQGVISMNSGRLKQALAYFTRVTDIAPEFAEGWNKRATVAYYMGDYETSVHDIQKTLALEPRHFGALSGLAMIYEAEGLEAQALDVLIQVKEIHPTMPGLDEQMEALRRAIEANKT
ncbi:MAG: tetratricopeptide repeat protein [Rhodospirillales bacterium]